MSSATPLAENGAKFITLEGTEGAGKSTNLQYMCEWFDKAGIAYRVTREPGGTEIAEKIRGLLLEHHSEKLSPMAELLLIFAARAQHIEQLIKPTLASGCWVISDRFTDATYAYQGAGRSLGEEKIELLENFVQASLRPDKTIILDVSVEVGMQRISQRGELDRFEKEPVAFFERVRRAYQYRAAEHPERYAVVDASKPLANVQQDISKVLEGLR